MGTILNLKLTDYIFDYVCNFPVTSFYPPLSILFFRCGRTEAWPRDRSQDDDPHPSSNNYDNDRDKKSNFMI